jgi:hypothetical protein
MTSRTTSTGRGRFGAHGRGIGRCGQANGAGGLPSGRGCRRARPRARCCATQLRRDGGKVDGLFGARARAQVDQHRVVIEKARGIGHALGQIGGKLRGVGGLEHHGHHGQRGAFEVKAGAGLRRRFKGHEWIAGMKGAPPGTGQAHRGWGQKGKVYCAAPCITVTLGACRLNDGARAAIAAGGRRSACSAAPRADALRSGIRGRCGWWAPALQTGAARSSRR